MFEEKEGIISLDKILSSVETLSNSIFIEPTNQVVYNPYTLKGLGKSEILGLYGVNANIMRFCDNSQYGEGIEITFDQHTVSCFIDKDGICVETNLCTNLLESEEIAGFGFSFDMFEELH